MLGTNITLLYENLKMIVTFKVPRLSLKFILIHIILENKMVNMISLTSELWHREIGILMPDNYN